jgi:hypothetical protein
MEVTTLKNQAQILGFADRRFAERGIRYASMAMIRLIRSTARRLT